MPPAQATWIAAAALLTLSPCGCGDTGRPQATALGFEGHDSGVADAPPSGDAAWVPPEVVESAIPWQLVGELKTDTYNGSIQHVATMNGWLYGLDGQSLHGGHRWKLADGTHERLEWQGNPDGLYETGGACQVGTKVFFLGGGGNGIFSQYLDYHWEVTDLVQQAWLTGGAHSYPYHMPGIARDGGRCFMVGGNSGGGLSPVAAVQEFVAATGTWDMHPPIPAPLVFTLAAYDQGLLVVAGGARALEPGDTTSTGQGVAVNSAWSCEVDAPLPSWKPGPALPTAVQGGKMLAVGGRFLVIGGQVNPEPGKVFAHLTQVFSWAPGDAAWEIEGLLPVAGPMGSTAITDGTSVFLVVLVQGEEQVENLLYRWDP